jgi:NET1-associated nuclear protein 1 (U3 small nucleolar RNA-associated protein 17)
VGCLSFTADGAYLLSGGAESVLVVWQLEEGRRTYLPRLGGGLRAITQFPRDAARVAVACADNAVRVVSLAALTVDAVVRGVRPATLRPLPPAAHPSAAVAAAAMAASATAEKANAVTFDFQPSPAVAFDPGSGTVALATVGAGLQLYDFTRDRHVADLDVAPRNLVSGDGGAGEPMEPYVSHAAFSADGSILVTVDRRSDRPMPGMQGVGGAAAEGAGAGGAVVQPEETLRIWERRLAAPGAAGEDGEAEAKSGGKESAAGGGGFVCVCVCDAPHGKAVTTVTLRGKAGRSAAMACTVSLDGDIKTWAPSHAARGGERAGWHCRSAATHPGIPPPALHAAAFSQDGSLLATAGVDVALWDPDACARLHTLSPPNWSTAGAAKDVNTLPPPMTGVAFVAGQPLLVGVSPAGMVVGKYLRINCSAYQVKPFCLSSETVLPIKPFYPSNATCTATTRCGT